MWLRNWRMTLGGERVLRPQGSGQAELHTKLYSVCALPAPCASTTSAPLQVMEICREVKRSIAVKRARFSALVPTEIKRAINTTVAPNKREADAVEARSVLDLRSGAAFTRFQTLLLQDAFDFAQAGVVQLDANGHEKDKLLISFGSCQYPTLGLIVKRHWCAVANWSVTSIRSLN
jgi:DNA topoisomerase